jgi:hypothetical protein
MITKVYWACRVLWSGPSVLFEPSAFRKFGGRRNVVLASWDGDGQLTEVPCSKK